MTSLNELIDYNAQCRLNECRTGHLQVIPKLFYGLIESIDSEPIGPRTREVIVEILSAVAALPECAEKSTGIKYGDPNALIGLLVREAKSDMLTEVSKHVLKDVFHNILSNKSLARKALGIKPGRPPDPLKTKANKMYAMLVLYYYEEVGILSSNRETTGAFVRAAAHLNKVDDPSDTQVRAARRAWETQEQGARRSWEILCDRYAEQGWKPIPKEDFRLLGMLDGY